MAAVQMETMLSMENETEAMQIADLLNKMTATQQNEMLIFAQGYLQGVRSAVNVQRRDAPRQAAVQ